MSINLIIIIIFIAAMFIVAILYRNSTLDKLPLLPGETILLEEKGLRIEQGGSSRSTLFINCIVRVTERRIIIAQKLFLRKYKYALRHVITYSGTVDEIELKTVLKMGYLAFAINSSEISIEECERETYLKIKIPESSLTRGQYVRIKTHDIEEYKKILRLR